MNSYVVTNIRLPEEDYLKLKHEAAKKRVSLAAVIREKVSSKKLPGEYAKKLLSIKGSWISTKEMKKNRAEVDQRVNRN